jgi:hypothetical protein
MAFNQVASTITVQNVPVQAQFNADGVCLGLVGPGGAYFSPPLTNDTINGAVINSSTIGLTTPAAITGTNIYATSQIGYAASASSTVTQLTNKATGVTINTPSGQITTANAQLAPAASVAFVVTCSAVSVGDSIIINIASGGTAFAYLIGIASVANGSFTVNLKNVSNNAYSEVLVLNYAILHVAS